MSEGEREGKEATYSPHTPTYIMYMYVCSHSDEHYNVHVLYIYTCVHTYMYCM